MRKRYLFLLMLLFPLATMLSSSRVYAEILPTDAEYEAAVSSIKNGVYYIVTEIGGVKYYVTEDGLLSEIEEEGGKFEFTKCGKGDFREYGFRISSESGKRFTNPDKTDDKANLNQAFFSTSTNDRDGWERQVLFMNSEGKIAIRSCNVNPSTSGWNDCGRTFWTYKIEDVGLPEPRYTYDATFIWTLEAPVGKEPILIILDGINARYADYMDDDLENPEFINIGDGFGQYADRDSWVKFWTLLQEARTIWDKMVPDSYDYFKDPDALSVDEAAAMSVAADSLYNKIIASEVPYKPKDGYYRIISYLRYASKTAPSGYVDKAIMASTSSEHTDRGVYATIDRTKANFLWKLTLHGDSILIQNAGMGTYLSFSSTEKNKLVMTNDEKDASHVIFDWWGYDYIETDDVNGDLEADVFSIRLAGTPKAGGNFVHQYGHGGGKDDNTAIGCSGLDSGKELELSFWNATYNTKEYDKGASEWYLEYVPNEEAQELIEAFAYIRDHDILVEKNNALRAKVLESLTVAKNAIKTKLITSASQMTSAFSQNDFGSKDGGDLSAGVLIDEDKSTYWHSAWSGTPQEAHYIQIADMQDMVGDCEMYLCERSGADNDRPTEFKIYGTDNTDLLEMTLGESWQENWVEMASLKIPNYAAGAESTIPFVVETAYPYIRVVCTNTDGKSQKYRYFWHAAELQLSIIRPNPNSQFAAIGKVGEDLDRIYKENAALSDANLTPEHYDALLKAYEDFLKAMVDPAELHNALDTYADLTKGVVEGTDPGQWTSTDIATAFDALYQEVKDYDESGKYTAAQHHKYAVMLKAMSKSIMERVNGVKTDTWYRLMYPTEEMFDAYGFDKSSYSAKSHYDDQPYQWGSYVVAGLPSSQTVKEQDGDGNEKEVTKYYLESADADSLREGLGLYFMDDELIQEKNASLFRFVPAKAEEDNNTVLFTEIKENIIMALDLSNTYTKGEALITDASQLSSNASDPSEGLNIEYLIDGNPKTFWHSDYHKKYLEPGYIQVKLNKPVSGLIQVDMTRRQGASNGHVVRMYVQGSNDGENWTGVGYLETPFTYQNESVTSMPLDLGDSYSYLRFILTKRYGTDSGGNMEFDPFAEITSEDEYNKKWTYFHAAEFQIYPVTADKELSDNGKALMSTYATLNKILMKDVTAEDVATAAQAYKTYQAEFNTTEGKAILPKGSDKASESYAIQNKATGLFIQAKGSKTNDVYLRVNPTLFTLSAPGYSRNLLHGVNLNGDDCTYLHSQNGDHRLVTWDSNTANSNSALVIREAETVEPAPFSFNMSIKPGKIYNWCNAVTLTNEGDGIAYTGEGKYTDADGVTFLALKEVETMEAGKPVFYIYSDTTMYNAKVEDAEFMKFTMAAEPDFVYQGETVNGFIGTLHNHSLKPEEIYFSGNHPVCIGKTGYYLPGSSVVVSIGAVKEVDPDGNYDFCICLEGPAEEATGLKNVTTSIQKISQPGDVYSMDGKLLRTKATLNSLKALGKGTYILNGVKVLVK